MKRFTLHQIPVLFILISITSCIQKQSKEEQKTMLELHTETVEKLKKEKEKCIIADTTFIYEIKAGMSPNQVGDFLSYAKNKGQLHTQLGKDSYYYTIMEFPILGKCKCEIYPQYYNQKLYKISLKAIPEKRNLPNNISWTYIKNAYIKKYGTEYYTGLGKTNNVATFIFKNKYINIINSESDGIIIEYGDFYYSSMKKNTERKESETSKRNTIDNI